MKPFEDQKDNWGKWARYLTQDRDGFIKAFEDEPYLEDGDWYPVEISHDEYGAHLYVNSYEPNPNCASSLVDLKYYEPYIDKGILMSVVTDINGEPVNDKEPSFRKGNCPPPDHYNTVIQPWDYMQANFSVAEFRGYLQGNILKYTSRYQQKGGLADLKKAQDYLTKLTAFEQGALDLV